MRNFLLALTLVLSPTIAGAQSWNQIAYYLAYIGPEDMRNSRGQPLGSLAGVLQQDRANFHRFGIRHPGDEGDPVFSNQALRARIPDMLSSGGFRYAGLESMARNGQPFTVNVFVCGYGMSPSVILLAGPGEDHSGCY